MLKGIAVSEGIAQGTAVCVDTGSSTGNSDGIYRKAESREAEADRFSEAMGSFIEETERAALDLEQRGMAEEAGILRSHIEMAKDPSVVSKINEEIDNGCCAEEAVDKTLKFFADIFEATGDELTMQRAADIRDINSSLYSKLTNNSLINLSGLPDGSVLVTSELTPSMAVDIDPAKTRGIIAETGGYTSHSAILARALGIPAVLGAEGALSAIKDGEQLILDGITGEILQEPDEDTKARYDAKAEAFRKKKEMLKAFKGKNSVTASGEVKEVFANIGNAEDAATARACDAEGVGLFRTEFLYMDRDSVPGEEEQFEAYSRAAKVMSPHPVIIRTLDIGGDKDIPYMKMDREDNPFMGFRAVRYCLENRELFKTQLRALLRANAEGNIRIMIPMVTCLQEIRDVRALMAECSDELKAEGKKFDPDVQIGIMVETPAAAATADILAGEADFFSIGTNDLTGYMMAADRGNAKVAYLYKTYQPAVLRMIRDVCSAAAKAGITVGMCGEAAADPALTPCLIAFGLDEFSVSPEKVLETRKNISLWSRDEAAAAAEKAMTLHTVEEIGQFLDSVKKEGGC